MSSHPPAKAAETDEEPAKKGSKGKLILIAVPVVLLLLGAGLWFTGILPHLLGMDHHEEAAAEGAKPPGPPTFIDVPEMVANLNPSLTPNPRFTVMNS